MKKLSLDMNTNDGQTNAVFAGIVSLIIILPWLFYAINMLHLETLTLDSALSKPVSEEYYCGTYNNYPQQELPAKCIKYYK